MIGWCSPEFAWRQKCLLGKSLNCSLWCRFACQFWLAISQNVCQYFYWIYLTLILELSFFRYLPIMNVTVKKLYYGYLLPNGTICEMRNIVPVMKEQALSLLWWESKSWNISRRKKDIVTPVIIVQRQLEIEIIYRNVIQFWPNMPVFIKWIPHILCLWRNLALLQKEWKKKV